VSDPSSTLQHTDSDSLPFLDDNGTGLGVATSTYLDAVVKAKDEDKDNVKRQFRGQEDPFRWFSFVPNMSRALDDAFKLWDAVGVALG